MFCAGCCRRCPDARRRAWHLNSPDTVFPLIYNCESPDIVIVHINPLEREEVPRTAREILDRVNEISFNSSLMREMRAICFVTRVIEEHMVRGNHLKPLSIHSISA